MANKMLIDATHPEETRVVVLRGNRVEEFDFETAHRKQLRGNIYLAKVTRVEPSLQAAFVDYGGNRHGFLAFSEIHPDYYQIPVADRQALLDEEAVAHSDRDEEQDEPRRNGGGGRRRRGRNRNRSARRNSSSDDRVQGDAPAALNEATDGQADGTAFVESAIVRDPATETETTSADAQSPSVETPTEQLALPEIGPDVTAEPAVQSEEPPVVGETANPPVPAEIAAENPVETSAEPLAQSAQETPAEAPALETPASPLEDQPSSGPNEEDDEDEDDDEEDEDEKEDDEDDEDDDEEEEPIDTVGGADAMDEVLDRTPRVRRQYKIQEVIKRRQIMLVQVVKEERGTKGAALTTYLSLAGRYSVLMPNTARGGGISRKITNSEDRKRLRDIAQELEVPEGMGVILRTAGASRTKAEVKRDFEYLMRLWETIRDLTLRSTAPTLVYEEGSLVKRSIRDLYSKDIEEIVVAGDEAHREAKDFMRMLMPSHAKNVRSYKENQPVFTRYAIEGQLDAMFSPTVQLKSGGYLVINQTEALVAIDVNSGRSTREHHIEDTALKTNLEAADEVSRQLRLRDLAGLIVIDFIDMDEKRNNRAVERRLKEALRNDRARIQVGRISHFGLMEMSRQRIRTSVLESSTEKCPHCGGSGHVRSVSSVALQLLRAVDEMLQKGATHNIVVRTRPETALYVLNHKRAHLRNLEERYRIVITIDADDSISGSVTYAIDRGEQVLTLEQARTIAAHYSASHPVEIEEEEEPVFDEAAEAELEEAAESEEPAEQEAETADGEREGNGRRKRRRRRGRGGRNEDAAQAQDGEQPSFTHETVPEHDVAHLDSYYAQPAQTEAGEAQEMETAEGATEAASTEDNGEGSDGEPRRRRRGRRGGRRNRRGRDDEAGATDEDRPQMAEAEESVSAYAQPDDQPRFEEQPRQFEPTAPVAVETAIATPAAPQPSASVPAEPAPQPAPRRRSTVREPAPVFAMAQPPAEPMAEQAPDPVAAPAPVAADVPVAAEVNETATPSADTTEAERPRRTGWWARRLLGGGKD